MTIHLSFTECSQALTLTSKQGCKRLSQNRPTNMSSGKWVGEAGVSWVVKNVIDDKSTYLPISFTLKLLYCCLFGNLNTPVLIFMLVNKSRGLKKELINIWLKGQPVHSPYLQRLYIQGRERLSPREWSPARIENLRVVGGVPSYVAIAQMPTPPISFFPTNCGRPSSIIWIWWRALKAFE